jgi:predicted RNase H-like nuclease
MKTNQEKHAAPFPNPRTIRRACRNELYRTVKRLKFHVPADLLKQGEELYVKRVIENLVWITANHSNRKMLADWWDESVCGDLAALWSVDGSKLSKAFRDAFGA